MDNGKCEFKGCDRPSKSRGYCQAHYKQLRRGSELKPIRSSGNKTCAGPSCTRTSSSKGLCKTHYAQLQSGNALAPIMPRKNSGGSVCTFPGCIRTVTAKGLCGTHDMQRRMGRELSPIMTAEDRTANRKPEMERFLALVTKTETCWNWAGATDKDGYGLFTRTGGTMVRAHRFSHQQASGFTPPHVDHICWNHGCVNPDHLRGVTPSGNGQNRSPGSTRASSGFRNVQKVLTKKGFTKYRVIITINGKPKMFGWYDDINEANRRAVELRRVYYPSSQW